MICRKVIVFQPLGMNRASYLLAQSIIQFWTRLKPIKILKIFEFSIKKLVRLELSFGKNHGLASVQTQTQTQTGDTK